MILKDISFFTFFVHRVKVFPSLLFRTQGRGISFFMFFVHRAEVFPSSQFLYIGSCVAQDDSDVSLPTARFVGAHCGAWLLCCWEWSLVR